jgi:hypothetical protein
MYNERSLFVKQKDQANLSFLEKTLLGFLAGWWSSTGEGSALRLELAEVFRAACSDGLTAHPAEGYGCGVFLLAFHGLILLRSLVVCQ